MDGPRGSRPPGLQDLPFPLLLQLAEHLKESPAALRAALCTCTVLRSACAAVVTSLTISCYDDAGAGTPNPAAAVAAATRSFPAVRRLRVLAPDGKAHAVEAALVAAASWPRLEELSLAPQRPLPRGYAPVASGLGYYYAARRALGPRLRALEASEIG